MMQSNDMKTSLRQKANIGPREIRKRRILGIVCVFAAALFGFTLFAYNAPHWARLLLFPLLWIGALGLFQAREKT